MKPARSKIICWKHLFVDTFLYICLNFLLGSDSAASLATCTFVFARISCSPTIQCKSVLNQKYFQHPTNQQHHPPQCWHRHMSGRWWWWGGERLHKDFPLSKTHRLPKDSILHQQHLQISFSSQLHKTNSSSCTSLELASENEREVGFLHSVPGLVLHWRRLPGWARGQTGFRWNRIPGRERGVFGLVVRLDGNR